MKWYYYEIILFVRFSSSSPLRRDIRLHEFHFSRWFFSPLAARSRRRINKRNFNDFRTIPNKKPKIKWTNHLLMILCKDKNLGILLLFRFVNWIKNIIADCSSPSFSIDDVDSQWALASFIYHKAINICLII